MESNIFENNDDRIIIDEALKPQDDGDIELPEGKNNKRKQVQVEYENIYDPLESKKLDFLENFLDVYQTDTIKEEAYIKKQKLSSKRLIDNKFKIKSYSEKFKIPKCTYITKEILPKVYICKCSYENLFIICESCKECCHKGHLLYEIDNSKLHLTCNCGEEDHEEREDDKEELQKGCLISSLFEFTTPRMFVLSKSSVVDSNSSNNNKDTVCGYCYMSNLLPNTKFKNFEYFKSNKEDDNYTKYFVSFSDIKDRNQLTSDNRDQLSRDEDTDAYIVNMPKRKSIIPRNTRHNCYSNLSDPIPLKAFLNYFNSVCSLKEGNSFANLYFLEHNINLFAKSSQLKSVFNDVFKDIRTYSENPDNNKDIGFVEDADLLRLFTSLFSILASESWFQQVVVDDFFKEFDITQKIKIIKHRLEVFASKNFDDEENENEKNSETIRSNYFLIEIVNDYFFSVYQFYVYIKNFFLKYNNNFSIFTILNMTIYQRNYYIFNCINFGNSYLTDSELSEFEIDKTQVLLALKTFPDLLLEWYERIIYANLFSFFIEDMEVHIHFIDIFVFLTRYDLLYYTIRQRLYSILNELLNYNLDIIQKLEKENKDKKKIASKLLVIKIDKALEIVYYGLCYFNDKIILANLDIKENYYYKNKTFIFTNKENDEEKQLLSKLFTLCIANIDVMINYFSYFEDKRYKINMSKINCIIKKILDLFLGNTQTQESESYLLSISNLSRFYFKVTKDYSNSVVSMDKNQQLLNIAISLRNMNIDYLTYKQQISSYVKNLEILINTEITSLVYSFNNKNSNTQSNRKKSMIKKLNTQNHRSSQDLLELQTTFRCTNCIQQIKNMINILSKSLVFFDEPILKKEQLSILMRFILLCVQCDFENLLILSDCNYLDFFEVFKDYGLKEFVNETAEVFYDEDYQFDNYFFISNIIILYFYYIDPNDDFTFSNYVKEKSKYDVIIKDKAYNNINLNFKTIDDHYNNSIFTTTTDSNLFKNLNSNNRSSIFNNINIPHQDSKESEHIYSSPKNNLLGANNQSVKNQLSSFYSNMNTISDISWIEAIYRVSKFFPVLIKIILSKDFSFEENIRIFELIDTKLQSFSKYFEKIYLELTSKDANNKVKSVLEDFLYNYYLLINLLFKQQIYQLDILKDSLKIFPKEDIHNFSKFNYSYLTKELQFSPKLSNQILIYIANLKSNLFLSILNADEDEIINDKSDKAFKINNDNLDEILENFYEFAEANLEVYPSSIHEKLILACNINSYLDYNSSLFNFKYEIIEMQEYIINQCKTLEENLVQVRYHNSFYYKDFSIYENFELTILKPLIYISNIFKEVKKLNSGKHNYDYFSLICHFLKATYMLYALELPDINTDHNIYAENKIHEENKDIKNIPSEASNESKHSDSSKANDDKNLMRKNKLKNHNINEKLPENHFKFIGESLDVLLHFKQISFYQIDTLIDLFEDVIYLISSKSNSSNNDNNSNHSASDNVFIQIYNKYKEEMRDCNSNSLTIIKLFEISDDTLNYGQEIISYLLKNQKFSLNKLENQELSKKPVPNKFNKKSKNKQKHMVNIDIKSSKLRFFNYFSYLTSLSTRQTLKYQEQFIILGSEGIKHAAYIVNTMVEKLFIVVYENTKKSHKNVNENNNNLFLVRLMKISLSYIISSSENFNQIIQTMYIESTELSNKLACNLIRIIYLIDECGIYDENLKQIAESYTDILLNLYLNTNQQNIRKLMKYEANEELDYSESNDESVFMESENEDGNKTILSESGNEQVVYDKTNAPFNLMIFDEENLVINLFYKINEILLNEHCDKLVQFKLHKTYSNIIKLARSIITSQKEITLELKKIFNPNKLLDFLTSSLKILYLKYVKGYDFCNDNLKEYMDMLHTLNNFQFNISTFMKTKHVYYQNEKLYNDDLFNLCCEIFILMNWMNVNGESDTRKLFKYLDEMDTENEQEDEDNDISTTIESKKFD